MPISSAVATPVLTISSAKPCMASVDQAMPTGSSGPKCGWIPIIPSGRSPASWTMAHSWGPGPEIPARAAASSIQDLTWVVAGVSGSHRMEKSVSIGTTRPPGRSTVACRRRTAAGSGTHNRTTRSTIASKGPPGAGSLMSPSMNCTCVRPRCPARSRARASASGERSTPTTEPPGPTRSAATNAASPAPQPRSRTRMPGRIPASAKIIRVAGASARPWISRRATSSSPIPLPNW